MKSCREAAQEWNTTERAVTRWCTEGRIEGAVKQGRKWFLPDDALKPGDLRFRTGFYSKMIIERKPLPIGISDYVRAQRDYYYVDKTKMIRVFLDQRPQVTLFTRPRRFGKTLNMDMLRVFFEKSEEDTSVYFRDKDIWKSGERYTKEQGKYPVIFLTFKDLKYDSWQETVTRIRGLLQTEYGRHPELQNSDRLADYEKKYYEMVLNGEADETELSSSLEYLSRMLYEHHGIAPVIIIDEYDTPIQEGFSAGFYDQITGFMRNFFSGAFKDNRYLSYGFLTGILRIAQESIFSGLNNLMVDTIMDSAYEDCFGFTETEVRKLLAYYGAGEKYQEVKEWYDGYLFGDTRIYNPWSVISYAGKNCVPQAYWVNTGKNEILDDVLKNADTDLTERLYVLLSGDKVVARIDENVVYRSLAEDPSNIYSLLLSAGYLKAENRKMAADGTWICEVSVPNKELGSVYRSEVLGHLISAGAVQRSTADAIAEGLYAGNSELLEKAAAAYLEKTISYYDAGSEAFYHGLLLGLAAMMDTDYKVLSERESGDGRYDICLIPRRTGIPGILIEIKWGRNLSDEQLAELSEEAYAQIEERNYAAEMKQEGIKDILKLGAAFSGKKVKMTSSASAS